MPFRGLVAAVLVLALMPSAPPADGASSVLPAGFFDERVAGASQITAIDFLPTGEMLVARKTGQLLVFRQDGTLLVQALDFSSRLCTESERGLVGLTVDPQFASNRYVYLFYTANRSQCSSTSSLLAPANRITRVSLGTDFGMVAGSEVVLIDGIVNRGGTHTGGHLAFGRNGYLHATTGDGGCHYQSGVCGPQNPASRERHTLIGKVIRITRNGAVAPGNPFANGVRCNRGPAASGQTCAEMYALGLRNPFRSAFDPNAATTSFYINDVGAGTWEEVNVGKSGADYGWNVREGRCNVGSSTNCPATPAGLTDPLHAYPHTSGCTSITGGAFVPQGVWPAPYDGSYLYTDFVCGKIFRLSGSQAIEFGRIQDGPVNMKFGPAPGGQALYYTTFYPVSEVRRIRYLGATNVPPTANLSASPVYGALPLVVGFDASASSDPEFTALTYRFDFGDGTDPLETTSPLVQHAYTDVGPFVATLIATDAQGAQSQPEQVTIHAGNTAPEVRITTPAPDYLFKVGDQIVLNAEATDAQDGALPGSSITWTVERVHNETHSHPYAGPTTGASLTVVAPEPEDLASTLKSYLLVRVSVTDSAGLTTEVTQAVRPQIVNLTIDSMPAGVSMTANGMPFVTRKSFKSWPGYPVRVIAPMNPPNKLKRFCYWSDGVKAMDRTITTLTKNVYLSAVYKDVIC